MIRSFIRCSLGRVLYLGLIGVFLCVVPAAAMEQDVFTPGQVWNDSAGNRINAHATLDAAVLTSPSGKVEAEIRNCEGKIVYSVDFDGKRVVNKARMGLVVDGQDFSESHIVLSKITMTAVDESYPLLGARATARNHYSAATIPLVTRDGKVTWTLEARAYDDGFAFRYVIPGEGVREVQQETTSFLMPARSTIWYFERNNGWKLKSYAGEWLSAPISRMPKVSKMGPTQGLPLVAELPQGGYALLTEAACWNYSGLRCTAVSDNTFVASLADTSFEIDGEIVTPWRVILCADDLNELVNSTIVTNLAPPPDATLYSDTEYIQPGRSVWRWWSSGTGTPEEERDYIDHAALLGYEYTTVDDGWKDWPDAWQEIEDLCAYASERSVGVFVWKHSNEVDDPANNWEQMRTFFDQVKAVGAVGIKIDFMNAETKAVIDFEIAALKLAAERELLINFHGCHKSTGEARTYPNEVTREGIRGLELNKMKEGPIPAWHNAALPFTRFIVGHADYTPFTVTPERLGPTTISHQLATVVCFTSPLQVIAEDPAKLLTPEFNELASVLKRIPTVWDETNVLPGSEIGDLAVMARREGNTWFIAALNGSDSREYKLDLSFLDDDTYTATMVLDRPDEPTQYNMETQQVNRQMILDLHMAKGGGFVILLTAEALGQ